MLALMPGTLKTFTGPMYAGKTSAILEKILWIKHCNNNVLVIKPQIDSRYSQDHIATHNRLVFPCFAMKDWKHVLDNYNLKLYNYHTVVIDEVQFMHVKDTLDVVTDLLVQGINVIAAGLNQDSRGIPFETTAMLLAMSDEITLIQSVCNTCGQPATKTQRIDQTNSRVVVGSVGMYEPRCLLHWTPK